LVVEIIAPMKRYLAFLAAALLVANTDGQILAGAGRSDGSARNTLKAGFTQAFVPFGVWSDKPGALFQNNDFNFYLDDEYGFGVEYQFFGNRNVGFQAGGFYYYASESDFVDDGFAATANSITLEGGGVYGGVTFKAGWDHFGFRSALNMGLFTFDYRMKLSHKTQFMTGYITEYKGEAISGPGSRIDAGLYGEFGKLGLYPSFQLMFLAKNGPSALVLKTLNISAGLRF